MLRELKPFIAAALAFHAPVSPTRWWTCARGLAAAHGWLPPMFLWAIAGLMFILNVGLGGRQNLAWLDGFNLLGLITWAIVAVLAMFITCGESASTVRRLGPLGATRPRFWFEIARGSWCAATISLAGMMMGLVMNNWQQRLFDDVPTALLHTLRIAAPVFFIAATIGYVLSFVRRSPRKGRAYDCVHYFYCLMGPIILITYAAMLAPPKANPRAAALPLLLGAIGLVWFVIGIISSIRRFEAWERKHTAACNT